MSKYKDFKTIKTNGIREYSEGFPVDIYYKEDEKRIVISARNQGGYDATTVDLVDLLRYIEKNIGIKTLLEDGKE